MKKEFLETIKKLYGDNSKVIITDSKLKTIYSSCPSLVENVKAGMFSRSSISPNDNKDIFPVKERTVLSLMLNGVYYAAVVTPFTEGKAKYYCIELIDSLDYIKLSSGLHAYLADAINVSELRKAVASIYASQLLTEQNVYKNAPEKTKKMCDKGCNIILRTITNQAEMLWYTSTEPERKTADIGSLAQEICALCSLKLLSAGGGKWQVTCDVQEGCLAVCKGERFAAVLLNLIENGLTYNISEKKQVHVIVEKKNGEVRVSVTDNGVGMGLDMIEKAFIPYALCAPEETYGCLGLPLADIFAKTYGGSAGIISRKDVGTTVTLRLPYSGGATDDCFSPTDSYSGERFSMLNIYMSRILDDGQSV